MASVKVKSATAPIRDGATNTIVGQFKQGQTVQVDGGPTGYYRVTPTVGSENALANSNLICAISDFEGGVTPTYPQFPKGDGTNRYYAGVNVIDQHSKVWDALGAGCRCISLTGTGDAAIVSQIKSQYPDATVILRPRSSTWNQRPANADDVITYWFYGVVPGCIHLAFNEGDAYAQGGPDFINRCLMEADIAVRVRDRGGLFAAGGWSMGNPNFDDPDVQRGLDILRPHYNGGYMGLNMHLYSIGMTESLSPPTYPYYMTRWSHLFDRFGFDRQLRNVICDEHGLDNSSNYNNKPSGGFPAQGASHDDLSAYCTAYAGATIASPVVAATLFTLNDLNQQWSGFNLVPYLSRLDAIWQ